MPQAGAEATAITTESPIMIEAKQLNRLKTNFRVIITDPARSPFQEAVPPLHDERSNGGNSIGLPEVICNVLEAIMMVPPRARCYDRGICDSVQRGLSGNEEGLGRSLRGLGRWGR